MRPVAHGRAHGLVGAVGHPRGRALALAVAAIRVPHPQPARTVCGRRCCCLVASALTPALSPTLYSISLPHSFAPYIFAPQSPTPVSLLSPHTSTLNLCPVPLIITCSTPHVAAPLPPSGKKNLGPGQPQGGAGVSDELDVPFFPLHPLQRSVVAYPEVSGPNEDQLPSSACQLHPSMPHVSSLPSLLLGLFPAPHPRLSSSCSVLFSLSSSCPPCPLALSPSQGCKGPQRRSQQRLDRWLEVAKAVWGRLLSVTNAI